MKTLKKLLGERIKELRKTKNLSQEKLSEKINIDSKHLSRIEVGRSYSSLDTLEKIAKALSADIEELFEFRHLENNRELKQVIIKMLNDADEVQMKLIYKLIKSVIH